MNRLPCLRFDGSNDVYSFDGGFLIGSEYTVIFVDQRRSSRQMWFLGGTNTTLLSPTNNTNFGVGYRDGNTVSFNHRANDFNSEDLVPAYTTGQLLPRVHIFRLGVLTGRKYYLNAREMGLTVIQGSGNNAFVRDFPNAAIGGIQGSTTSLFYEGDLMEIIMFNRALSNYEMSEIEDYLSKKWKITL